MSDTDTLKRWADAAARATRMAAQIESAYRGGPHDIWATERDLAAALLERETLRYQLKDERHKQPSEVWRDELYESVMGGVRTEMGHWFERMGARHAMLVKQVDILMERVATLEARIDDGKIDQADLTKVRHLAEHLDARVTALEERKP